MYAFAIWKWRSSHEIINLMNCRRMKCAENEQRRIEIFIWNRKKRAFTGIPDLRGKHSSPADGMSNCIMPSSLFSFNWFIALLIGWLIRVAFNAMRQTAFWVLPYFNECKYLEHSESQGVNQGNNAFQILCID